jgi:hypothetical protein
MYLKATMASPWCGRGGDHIRRGVRPWHVRRGRPRNLGGPRLSSIHSGVAESRGPVADARHVAGARVVGLKGPEQAPAAREATRQGNQRGGGRGQGVGGRQRSEDVGERDQARTRPSKGGPCWCELRKGTMPHALTLDDMSPRLRKGVGRASPRVTSTEEPDGGNLLVRIWRGAGVGNLPAYSTTAFSTDRVRLPWRAPHQGVPEAPRTTGRPPAPQGTDRTGGWGRAAGAAGAAGGD